MNVKDIYIWKRNRIYQVSYDQILDESQSLLSQWSYNTSASTGYRWEKFVWEIKRHKYWRDPKKVIRWKFAMSEEVPSNFKMQLLLLGVSIT